MSFGHEHNGEAGGQHDHSHHGPRVLPASLAAPEILSAWRMRALIVFAVATILSIFFAFSHEGKNHILRAYLLGYMICFSFAGGGLAMLMLQYVSGGKWGLLLRRPLEAMTRTCPGGVPAVWRSENGGDSWKKLTRGLPKKESFFTVQRDALDVDKLKAPALYFGTTTGQLWMGSDGGEEWSCLFDSLPPIHCVKVAVV